MSCILWNLCIQMFHQYKLQNWVGQGNHANHAYQIINAGHVSIILKNRNKIKFLYDLINGKTSTIRVGIWTNKTDKDNHTLSFIENLARVVFSSSRSISRIHEGNIFPWYTSNRASLKSIWRKFEINMSISKWVHKATHK